jgi:glycosyltransferase involved in cell wall biosynthesis
VASKVRLRTVTHQALSGAYNLAYYGGMADELGSAQRLLALFEGGTTPALAPRVGFVLEQTLGHVTHSANLQHLIGPDPEIDAVFEPIAFDVKGVSSIIPGFGNWTVRAGVRARRAIRKLRRSGPVDALFVHTQVPAVLSPDHLKRIPTVVSLDATPIQYDELGAAYGHATGGSLVEKAKWKANVACFRRARAIVTWAEWTKTGLIDRYEVDPEKVHVIPPGVDYERWSSYGHHGAPEGGPLKVLFVGGDLERKGGLLLLEAIRTLRAEGLDIELDLVTRDDVVPQDGVVTHKGLTPNSPRLIALYHGADVFCLPTLGDCLPMVLSEAGAVGLPLVSTDVGAIREIVRDGETGLLVPVGSALALADALRRLAEDPAERRAMGERARDLVRTDFDAATNARRLVALLRQVGGRGRTAG